MLHILKQTSCKGSVPFGLTTTCVESFFFYTVRVGKATKGAEAAVSDDGGGWNNQKQISYIGWYSILYIYKNPKRH